MTARVKEILAHIADMGGGAPSRYFSPVRADGTRIFAGGGTVTTAEYMAVLKHLNAGARQLTPAVARALRAAER